MALNVWTQRSGYRFSTIQERSIVNISLPSQNDSVTTVLIGNAGTGYPTNGGSFYTTGGSGTGMTIQVFSPSGYLQAVSINNPGVGYRDGDVITILAGGNNATVILNIEFLATYSVISGKLPPGLRIVNNTIQGTPFEVPRTTEFEFVIRATNGTQIADRTFFWTVEGADQPVWQTAAGSLPIGPNNVYYILDSSYIDFQLMAVDTDTAAGQSLKYFIASNDGSLPPGLVLTDSGRIVGWVQPALVIPDSAGNGYFDTAVYDTVAFDFGYRSTNGYDSYIYDNTIFDFSTASLSPKKLNRNYEFIVTITDGDTEVKRKFKIYVVGDDYFRADNTITTAGSGSFMVDATYVRAPIWVTPANLGVRRANNYQTIRLDTYEDLDLGPIIYSLDASKQWAQTTNYKINDLVLYQSKTYLCLEAHTSTTSFATAKWQLQELPPGMQFDPSTAEVFGVVPYQPAITKTYRFTVTATRLSDRTETASSQRTFTVQVLGEVESVMSWVSNPDLGIIEANLISNLSVVASSTVTDSVILYVKTEGELPPGLTLALDGEIVGKVSQFGDGAQYQGIWTAMRSYNANTVVKYNNIYYKAIINSTSATFNTSQWAAYSFANPGIVTVDGGSFTLDAGTTTFDRVYSFTIQSRDILGYNAISRTFSLTVNTPNNRLYSNITARPYLKLDQREMFKSFIRNGNVFDATAIYRPGDSNFGIQNDLKMTVYSGIETKTAAQVVSVVGQNHTKKRFKLGEVKKAQAKIPGTNTVVYEVVYIDVIDPLEIGDTYLDLAVAGSIDPMMATVDQTNIYFNGPFDTSERFWGRPQPYSVTADRSDVYPDGEFRGPSSITLWRKRIEQLGLHDRNYMPLWMRTVQDGSVQELGFVSAIPLCFCKVGRGEDIMLNIKNYLKTTPDFSFNKIDYTIDRYTIDSVTGDASDKYIVFRNDRTIIA